MNKLLAAFGIVILLTSGCGDPPCASTCPKCSSGYVCRAASNNKNCFYCDWEMGPGGVSAGLTVEAQDMCHERSVENQQRRPVQQEGAAR